MRRWTTGAAALILTLCGAGEALGWGSTGHRMVGKAAIETLPPELPAFLRAEASAVAVGELSREPDRSRDSGKAHDSDRDPGHFVDADDAGKIGGTLTFQTLPATREEYDTALRAAGAPSSWKVGYLPYSIVEDWQQLAKDFAYWRADDAGAKRAGDPAHRAWLEADRARREALILTDIGALSHFVGDGSMPLHVSIHYNGWGAFPNPDGYTQDKVHVPFEGAFVRANVAYGAVLAHMQPFHDCHCPMEQRVGTYLAGDLATVIPFYQLQKTGAFAEPNARGAEFAATRLAVAASELRDEIVLAWRASDALKVGYPEVDVSQVESGAVDPYDYLLGED